MPLSVMSFNTKEPVFSTGSFFDSQNFDLGFFTNDQDTIFHVGFKVFSIQII